MKRLLVVATGSINVAVLPWWLANTRLSVPDLELRVVLTRTAARFVSQEAVSVITGIPCDLDEWPRPSDGVRHTELARWPDAFVVYPATANYIARLADGAADTPTQIALHCTRAPIVVAPCLPPGMLENGPALRRHLRSLQEWPNLDLVRPTPGRSWSTGADDAALPPPFPSVVELAARRVEQSAATPADASLSDPADRSDDDPHEVPDP